MPRREGGPVPPDAPPALAGREDEIRELEEALTRRSWS